MKVLGRLRYRMTHGHGLSEGLILLGAIALILAATVGAMSWITSLT